MGRLGNQTAKKMEKKLVTFYVYIHRSCGGPKSPNGVQHFYINNTKTSDSVSFCFSEKGEDWLPQKGTGSWNKALEELRGLMFNVAQQCTDKTFEFKFRFNEEYSTRGTFNALDNQNGRIQGSTNFDQVRPVEKSEIDFIFALQAELYNGTHV